METDPIVFIGGTNITKICNTDKILANTNIECCLGKCWDCINSNSDIDQTVKFKTFSIISFLVNKVTKIGYFNSCRF